MKLPLALLALAISLLGADLSHVKRVYLLPMGSGADQHLANHLTITGTFAVVADPKLADAVFTDRLGKAFEERFEELYPPPPPPPAPAPPEEAEEKKSGDSEEPAKADEKSKLGNRPMRSSSAGSRGTLFLVDAKSKTVLWSTYDEPKDTSPAKLDESAKRKVERLRKDLGIVK